MFSTHWPFVSYILSFIYSCVQVLLRSRVSSPSVVFRGECVSQESRSPRALFEACSQTLEKIAQEVKHKSCFQAIFHIFSCTDWVSVFWSSSQAENSDSKLVGSLRGTAVQHELYSAVSAASSWLDAAENQMLSGPVLLSDDTETQLTNLEVLKILITYDVVETKW